MKLDKKGQLGKIITTFPIMLLIFLIIGGYLILAGFAFGVKGQKIPVSIEEVNLGDVIFKDIELNGEKIMLVDALIGLDEGIIKREEIDRGLEKAFNENKYVLLLNVESNSLGRVFLGAIVTKNIILLENNKITYSSRPLDILNNYRNEELLKKVSFNINKEGKKFNYNIEYYYGEALK